MNGPASRRKPFPWHGEIDLGDGAGFQGVLFEADQEGLLKGKKEQSLANVVPSLYQNDSQNPTVEATFNFTRLTGGMGEKVQTSANSKRYRYATGVDCSIGGMPRLGPLFTASTLPAALANAQDVAQFVVGPGAASFQLFCLRGQGVYLNTGGVWTLSKDFGAFNYPQQAVLFRGTAGGLRLLVATAMGELWGFDGTNPWAQAPFAAGEAAYWIEVVAHEVFIGGVNDIRVATADPLVAGSFGGAITIGHLGTRITYLKAVSNELFIFKEDGVYSTTTVAGTVEDNDLFPELRVAPAVTNGRNAAAWSDALWFAYGGGYYRMEGGSTATLTPIGPERMAENDSPVRGIPVSGAGFADWFLFLGIYNTAQNASYLMKYGTWTNTDASANYEFADVWNGAIASWTGKKITRIDVIYLATNPVLWVGFSDGTIQQTNLPAGTPDPAADTNCTYTSSGLLYWPLHHAMYESTIKAFHGFSAVGPVLNANQTVYHAYRTDLTVGYTNLTPNFTTSGQRVELPDTTAGVILDCATELRTASSTLTPVLEGMTLHEAIRPALRLAYTAVVRAANRLVRRDGIVSRRSATSIRTLCKAAAAAPGSVRLRLPEGTLGSFAAIQYGETLADPDRTWGLEWACTLELFQLKTT